MGREPTDLRARVQALLDRQDAWGVARLLREEHEAALRAHVEKRLRRANRPADRAADVCADVWKDVDDSLQRRPTPWQADRQLAYLSQMANNKIVDLGKALDRVAAPRRDADGREQSLLDAISGPSRARPDRTFSRDALREALDGLFAALGTEAATLIELTALDQLDPRDIARRAGEDRGLAHAIGLDDAVAKIAAAPDDAARARARANLEGLVRTRLSRARKAAAELMARHPLLQHYCPPGHA